MNGYPINMKCDKCKQLKHYSKIFYSLEGNFCYDSCFKEEFVECVNDHCEDVVFKGDIEESEGKCEECLFVEKNVIFTLYFERERYPNDILERRETV